MDAETEGPRCVVCELIFTPDRRNVDSQKICGRSACRETRDRDYQNDRRKARRVNDPAWARGADARSSESRRMRKERERAARASAVVASNAARRAEEDRRLTSACLVGLLAHVVGVETSEEAERIFARMSEKGMGLMPAALAPWCQSSRSPRAERGGDNQDAGGMNIPLVPNMSATKRGGCQSRRMDWTGPPG